MDRRVSHPGDRAADGKAGCPHGRARSEQRRARDRTRCKKSTVRQGNNQDRRGDAPPHPTSDRLEWPCSEQAKALLEVFHEREVLADCRCIHRVDDEHRDQQQCQHNGDIEIQAVPPEGSHADAEYGTVHDDGMQEVNPERLFCRRVDGLRHGDDLGEEADDARDDQDFPESEIGEHAVIQPFRILGPPRTVHVVQDEPGPRHDQVSNHGQQQKHPDALVQAQFDDEEAQNGAREREAQPGEDGEGGVYLQNIGGKDLQRAGQGFLHGDHRTEDECRVHEKEGGHGKQPAKVPRDIGEDCYDEHPDPDRVQHMRVRGPVPETGIPVIQADKGIAAHLQQISENDQPSPAPEILFQALGIDGIGRAEEQVGDDESRREKECRRGHATHVMPGGIQPVAGIPEGIGEGQFDDMPLQHHQDGVCPHRVDEFQASAHEPRVPGFRPVPEHVPDGAQSCSQCAHGGREHFHDGRAIVRSDTSGGTAPQER